jgi:hypothetical protein
VEFVQRRPVDFSGLSRPVALPPTWQKGAHNVGGWKDIITGTRELEGPSVTLRQVWHTLRCRPNDLRSSHPQIECGPLSLRSSLRLPAEPALACANSALHEEWPSGFGQSPQSRRMVRGSSTELRASKFVGECLGPEAVSAIDHWTSLAEFRTFELNCDSRRSHSSGERQSRTAIDHSEEI